MINPSVITNERKEEIKIKASMYNRFDFEQQIMTCWNVTSDIDDVYGHFYELDIIDNDDLANVLLGIKSLYDIKFNRLFEMFELCIAKESELELKVQEQQKENSDLKLEVERLKSDLVNHPRVGKNSEV